MSQPIEGTTSSMSDMSPIVSTPAVDTSATTAVAEVQNSTDDANNSTAAPLPATAGSTMMEDVPPVATNIEPTVAVVTPPAAASSPVVHQPSPQQLPPPVVAASIPLPPLMRSQTDVMMPQHDDTNMDIALSSVPPAQSTNHEALASEPHSLPHPSQSAAVAAASSSSPSIHSHPSPPPHVVDALHEQQILEAAATAARQVAAHSSPVIKPEPATVAATYSASHSHPSYPKPSTASPPLTSASPQSTVTSASKPPPSPIIMPTSHAAAVAAHAPRHTAATPPPSTTLAAPPATPASSTTPTPKTEPATTSPALKTAVSRAMARSYPVSNATGDITRCPCGDNADQEGFMIQCETCEIWQHGSCIGLSEKTTPEQYYCELCDRDNPIHQAFRKLWGDKTPIKGKTHKIKGKKGEKSRTIETIPEVTTPSTPAPAAGSSKTNKDKKSSRRPSTAATTTTEPTKGDTNTAPPPSHKRKRDDKERQERDGATSIGKPPRGKKLDEAGANSPDLTKRARLEDSKDVSAPGTPAPRAASAANVPNDYEFPSALTGDLAALAAELSPDASGADLTPAGSREARKIQRYIQMIQKMENTSKKGAGSGTGTNEDGHEDVPMDEEAQQAAAASSAAVIPPLPPQLNQVYSAASQAREARVRLRAEKLEQQESGGDATDENTSSDLIAPPPPVIRKPKAKKQRREEDAPALTPQEIRKLRLTASSQLRPLGPMYFGRKQFLLQSYRDESLQCETGWAVAIHEPLPMAKRVVHNYRIQQQSQQDQKQHDHQHPTSHHHHHAQPSTIFPPTHPWSIPHKHTHKSKAKHDKPAQEEECVEEDEEEKFNDVKPMEIEPTETDAAAGQGAISPQLAGVKTEDVMTFESLPAPEAFFASIDTSILPSKIQSIISAFNSSPQPPLMPAAALASSMQSLPPASLLDIAATPAATDDSNEQVAMEDTLPASASVDAAVPDEEYSASFPTAGSFSSPAIASSPSPIDQSASSDHEETKSQQPQQQHQHEQSTSVKREFEDSDLPQDALPLIKLESEISLAPELTHTEDAAVHSETEQKSLHDDSTNNQLEPSPSPFVNEQAPQSIHLKPTLDIEPAQPDTSAPTTTTDQQPSKETTIAVDEPALKQMEAAVPTSESTAAPIPVDSSSAMDTNE